MPRTRGIFAKINSDLTSFGALTITSTGTTPNKPSAGNIQVDDISVQRIGDQGRIVGKYKHTAAGTVGTGDYLYALPGGLQFDPAKTTFFTTVIGNAVTVHPQGLGTASGSSTTNVGVGQVVPYDATHFRLALVTASNSGTNIGMVSAGIFPLNNSTQTYEFDFMASILGWSADD